MGQFVHIKVIGDEETDEFPENEKFRASINADRIIMILEDPESGHAVVMVNGPDGEKAKALLAEETYDDVMGMLL